MCWLDCYAPRAGFSLIDSAVTIMNQGELSEATLKRLFKQAFVETLYEQRELSHDVFAEFLEHISLAAAIREGRRVTRQGRRTTPRLLRVRSQPHSEKVLNGI